MRRLFWLGLGVVAGVAIARKATATTKQLTPAGIAENLGDAVSELAGAIGSFGADVRAGMSERETELAEVVERAQEPLGSRSRRQNRPVREPRHERADSGWLSGLDESPRSGSEGARRARRAEG
ncbi:chromosome condensin MukBEF MukE localization factor [Crossiella equi]|uniref:Chromosome condensin MukBEF MukE localization factor n=1 Tax=Crossiella equi TaxID=130796 RepID=A0ABS5A8M1_9PSEU|nr:hypothetical protein [Crossiella equi]MBP2472931.1 chromosome condensin MukBEF MukE localization factor [Crossiella equi]